LESIGNIVGTIPAVANPVLTYDGTLLTSIAVTTTWDHTVVILGTGDGFVKKVCVCPCFFRSWSFDLPSKLRITRLIKY